MEIQHVQINGKPLCRAPSKAYIEALGEPKGPQLCHCRHTDPEKAVTEAQELQSKLDPEVFKVTVAPGACSEPNGMCFMVSAPGTH